MSLSLGLFIGMYIYTCIVKYGFTFSRSRSIYWTIIRLTLHVPFLFFTYIYSVLSTGIMHLHMLSVICIKPRLTWSILRIFLGTKGWFRSDMRQNRACMYARVSKIRAASIDFKSTMILTHWGRATHICVGKLTIIGSDNGLSPGRRQAIIWTNAGILLIGPLGTNFSEIVIEIRSFSFKKMHLKMSSGKWRPFCLGLNVITM